MNERDWPDYKRDYKRDYNRDYKRDYKRTKETSRTLYLLVHGQGGLRDAGHLRGQHQRVRDTATAL